MFASMFVVVSESLLVCLASLRQEPVFVPNFLDKLVFLRVSLLVGKKYEPNTNLLRSLLYYTTVSIETFHQPTSLKLRANSWILIGPESGFSSAFQSY